MLNIVQVINNNFLSQESVSILFLITCGMVDVHFLRGRGQGQGQLFMKVETNIIASITTNLIGRTVALVKTFKDELWH
jgi:hypothetical protein